MKVGYVSVSTQEQILDLQEDALEKQGCTKVFTDKISGMKGGRPQGLVPKDQKMAKAVGEMYESNKQSTTQIMHFFGIGSRRTLYKILHFAGVQVKGFQKSTEKQDSLP